MTPLAARLPADADRFDSNTTPPVYTKTSFKQGYYQDGQPIEQQHKITALRYKKVRDAPG